MKYAIKLYDKDLLRFEVLENLADPIIKINWINEAEKHLLPLGMSQTDEGVSRWLKQRTIPKNRAFVNSFLAKCGLSANRPMDIISVCRGVSLNDSYWISNDDFEGSYKKVNLYDNNFSQILASIAFTGYGSSVRSSFASSPEFTTNGMLPKCWRRINRKIYLYKGATSGASNTGMEPYSEKYASIIGKQLGFNVIDYSISKWKGNTCSVCELFTSKEIGFVPVGRIVKHGGMKAVREFYESLGEEYVKALNEMLVFDALIFNTDRHFGNFGFLIDNHTNKIIAPVPLFDHGNSLFNYAGEENWQSVELMDDYASTLLPCVYDDFVEEAKRYLDDDLRCKIRKALTISIKKEKRYNYSNRKLSILEKEIRKRAKELLE